MEIIKRLGSVQTDNNDRYVEYVFLVNIFDPQVIFYAYCTLQAQGHLTCHFIKYTSNQWSFLVICLEHQVMCHLKELQLLSLTLQNKVLCGAQSQGGIDQDKENTCISCFT